MVATSDGSTPASRCSTTSAGPSAPIRRSSATGIVPSASPSMRMNVVSAGQESRTRWIFASCSASSQKTATDSECWSTYAHSSGELVG